MKKTLIIIIAVLGVGLVGFWQFFSKVSQPTVEQALILSKPRAVAPFSLTDNKNMSFTEKNLLGQWDILFFGYTSCPDICPATLQTMQAAWEKLVQLKAADDMRFIFVSIDPKRDTPEQLNNYLSYFNPTFIGLSGDEQEITRLTTQFGVYFIKTMQNNDAQNYLMEHTGSVVFIDPVGNYYANLSPPFDASVLVKEILAIKASYK